MKELTFQGAWLPLKRGNSLRVQGERQQDTSPRRETTGYVSKAGEDRLRVWEQEGTQFSEDVAPSSNGSAREC